MESNPLENRRPAPEGVEKAANAAHDTIPEAETAAAAAVAKWTAEAHRLVDRLSAAAKPAVNWTFASADGLRQSEGKLLESMADYTREHPFAALTGALAAGLLLGRLIGPRSHD
jgi:ElaB/YqjD/DUF883 family membrane-anchored ribosome-binding protein